VCHLLHGIIRSSVIGLLAGLLLLLFLLLCLVLVSGKGDEAIGDLTLYLSVDGGSDPASVLLGHRLRVGGELPRLLRRPLFDLRFLVGAPRFEMEVWVHEERSGEERERRGKPSVGDL